MAECFAKCITTHPKGDFPSWLSSNGKLKMPVTLCQHTHPFVQQRGVIRRQCTAFWHLPCHSYNRGAERRYGREHQRDNGRKMAPG